MTTAVDVVIPVYNACELTRRCIESLYTHAASHLGRVLVHDNASEPETRDMLDSLDFPGLEVVHAEQNTGFGDAVNRTLARTGTPIALVLNSDVEARDDFVAPLLERMEREPELAAITPGGNTFANYDFSRYALRAGCVVTYSLQAYAFAVRRSAWEEVGGFDPVFGLGYYEDADLSRRLVDKGYWIGIDAGTALQHETHGSFRERDDFRQLLERNRGIYYDRHATARRQVLLVSRDSDAAKLPESLRTEMDVVLRGGGEIHWVCRGAAQGLPALQVDDHPGGLRQALRQLRKRSRKRQKQLRELWLTADVPPLWARWIERRAQAAELTVRHA